MSFVNILLFLGIWLVATRADNYGWDISQLTNQTVMSCLQKVVKTDFIVFSGYSNGKPSTELCSSLQFAKENNVAIRDVRFFPCPNCGASAEEQVTGLVDYLKQNCDSLWSKRVWLDMNSHQYWSTPWRPEGWVINQRWFNDMVDACTAQKEITCGIYSSADEWGYTLGSKTYTYAPATKLPLWWKKDDEVASFDGFTSFGGFTQPMAKQFKSSYSLCGTTATVGENWAPCW